MEKDSTCSLLILYTRLAEYFLVLNIKFLKIELVSIRDLKINWTLAIHDQVFLHFIFLLSF